MGHGPADYHEVLLMCLFKPEFPGIFVGIFRTLIENPENKKTNKIIQNENPENPEIQKSENLENPREKSAGPCPMGPGV